MTRDVVMAIDSVFEPFEEHRAKCRKCSPWSCCATAARLLREASDEAARRLAPIRGDVLQPKAKA